SRAEAGRRAAYLPRRTSRDRRDTTPSDRGRSRCSHRAAPREAPRVRPRTSSHLRLAGPQPRPEERPQFLAADLLRETPVLPLATDPVALLHPATAQLEERLRAYLASQRMQRHRTAVVDRIGEDPSSAGIVQRHGPELGTGGATVRSRELPVERRATVPRGPHPLRVRRVPLVEPDVLPAPQCHGIAEPLVRHLVHNDAARRSLLEEAGVVHRARLILQGVPERRRRHEPADPAERVRAPTAFEEPRHTTRRPQRTTRGVTNAWRQPLVVRVQVSRTRPRAAAIDV